VNEKAIDDPLRSLGHGPPPGKGLHGEWDGNSCTTTCCKATCWTTGGTTTFRPDMRGRSRNDDRAGHPKVASPLTPGGPRAVRRYGAGREAGDPAVVDRRVRGPATEDCEVMTTT